MVNVAPAKPARAAGMVERRPCSPIAAEPDLLSHLVLILGVIIVAFPLYLTFVASTHTVREEIMQAPMPLLPGVALLGNYKTAWNGTGAGRAVQGTGRRDDVVSLVTA
jgi:sn-glycerol 3-phosphate transport system permease protein